MNSVTKLSSSVDLNYNKTFSGTGPETLLNYLSSGYCILDYDLKFIYVNEAFASFTPWSRLELQGQVWTEIVQNIGNKILNQKISESLVSRMGIVFENYSTFKNAPETWLEFRIEPIPEGICILALDITERKREEEKQRKKIQSLEKMMQVFAHRVRQPVSQITALTGILHQFDVKKHELIKTCSYIKSSISSLDSTAKELADFISNQKKTDS